MISLDKCNGIYKSVNDLSMRICALSKTKDVNVNVFNMITNRNEAKKIVKHIPCGCKWKFNSATCNSNQKWNNETCQCECRNYLTYKKDNSWNPSTCICENAKYLKSSTDDSKIAFDEIIYFMDIVSTNVTSIMSTNVTSTMLTNFCNKKLGYKMNCYILHTVLLVIM